jgi:ATP phosphoribosyltransferase regulatory subunit
MLQTFSVLDVNDIYLDIGNVDIYRGLAKQAGLSEEVEGQLFDMLQRKAITEINELLDSLDLDDGMKTMLSGLSSLNGGKEVFVKAKILLADADAAVIDAIDYLEQTAELMWQRFGDIRV